MKRKLARLALALAWSVVTDLVFKRLAGRLVPKKYSRTALRQEPVTS